MINITTINENFTKYKVYILETILLYYGKEFHSVALKKVKPIHFDFSSLPLEEYLYIQKHLKDYSSQFLNTILKRYDSFKEAEEKFKIRYCKILQDTLEKKINIQTKNFDFLLGEILNKELNKKSFQQYICYFKKMSDNMSLELQEEIFDICEFVQTQYRNSIMENIFLREDSKFFEKLSTDQLTDIFFKTKPYSKCFYASQETTPVYSIIKIPVIALLNQGIKIQDVYLIQELIRLIETCGNYIGISIQNETKTNQIINEIRIQKLAVKISESLHSNGVFIIDDPKDCNLKPKLDCEKLFPFTETFIEDNESFFNNCAIRNTPELLENKFGKVWNFYSEYINYIYNNKLYEKGVNTQITSVCFDAIEKMNSYAEIKGRK